MRPYPALADRDWYTARETSEILSGPDRKVSLRSVYRNAVDRLGAKLVSTGGDRSECQIPKALVDAHRGRGMPTSQTRLKTSAAARPMAKTPRPNSPGTQGHGYVPTTDRLVGLLEETLARSEAKDADLQCIKEELAQARTALALSDHQNSVLEEKLAGLRADYDALLTIAERAKRDGRATMDGIATSPGAPKNQAD